jgi:hypothetical protein
MGRFSCERGGQMGLAQEVADYRVFFIGTDGNFEGTRTFVCDTDETAIAWVLMEERPLELWSGTRLVKRVPGGIS